MKPPAKACPLINAIVGIGYLEFGITISTRAREFIQAEMSSAYVKSLLNRANKLLGKNPLVEEACSRSRPLLKNFWMPDVVITTPCG
jgi:hypothetical protein